MTTFTYIGTNIPDDQESGTSLQHARTSCKNILYTVVNSRAYANVVDLGTPPWLSALQTASLVIYVLLPQKENGTQGEQRIFLILPRFGAKNWHITHLKELVFRVGYLFFIQFRFRVKISQFPLPFFGIPCIISVDEK